MAACMQAKDLESANNFVLMSHVLQQRKNKTTSVAAASTETDLNIHKRRSKYQPNHNNGESIEVFKSLDSIIDEQGVFSLDVKARIDKAMAKFLQLNNNWN
ncbi:unnamed protein product [Schistosoma curassoni]|uniref:Uncharacterized protein n=1 Tax=Schistosoma curassoni TaxID=6186 RepID=A0A183JVJ0_9TREM|nr:unnamed protein product [Schistosoma curassoni]